MLERHEAGPCRARVAPANAPREGEANAALLADKKDEEGGVRQTSTHVEMGSCLLYTSPSPRDS